MSALDDYMAGQEQEFSKRNKLAQSLGEAASVNPDEFANQVKLAKAAAISVEALPQYKEVAQQAKLFGEVGLATMWKDAPKTAEFYSHPDHAKLSSDDHANLTGFEQAASFLKNSGKALASGVPKFNEGMWGVLQAGGEALPSVVGDPIAGFAKEQRGYSKYNADQLLGKADGNLEAGWNSGLQSLGNNLLQLPLAIFGGAAPLLTSMGLSTGGGAYGQARDQGLDRGKAFSFGATQGMIEVGTEMIGMPALLSMLKPGAFGKKALEYLYKDQFGEQIATHTQDLNEWASLPENKDKTFADYLAARPDAAIQTAIATAVGGGGQVAVMKAVEAVVNRGAQREQEAQQAGQMGELLTGMTKLAEASKLRERDVETAQGFFQSVLDEGRDSVFITPEALAQSGLAEQIAQAIPAVAEQMQSISKHDIRLPIAELMATMAGPELAQSIIPHVAVDPGGFTPTTAQEYMQSDKAAELQAEVEKILGEKQVDDTFRASAEIVKSRIISELTATTRWDAAKNEADATIYSAYYAVRAAQLGVTPETLYDQRRVNFSDVLVDGQQYDQTGKLITDTPNFKNWFGESKVVDESGKPIVVYHGTVSEFSKFKQGMGEYGTGSYFTNRTEIANLYSEAQDDGSERSAPNIVPVYIKIANPYRVDATGEWVDVPPSRRKLEALGYDGIVVDHGRGENEYVVFRPPQIKSAIGNSGQFDANDPNILHQSAKTGRGLSSMLSAPPVDVQIPESMKGKHGKALRDEARSLYPDNETEENEQSGEVVKFVVKGFREMKSHSGDERVMQIVPALHDLFKNATPLWTNQDDGTHPGVKLWHNYGVRANLNGQDVVIRLAAREMSDGTIELLHYDADVRQTSEVQKVMAGGLSTPMQSHPAATTTDISASKDMLIQWALKVNAQEYNQKKLGAFSPQDLTVTMLQGANFTTTLHEGAHFFFENDIFLASKILADADIHGYDTLSVGEKQILDDVSKLMDWHGIKGDITAQLRQWENMDFEERRSHHERTAESFERYLFEGKAPSIELQPYFQRFAAWWKHVYTSFKNFLAKNPEAGKLNPEITAVFDRMLATTEQIILAEQGRSMMPMFRTQAEADNIGMTPEEFSAIQLKDVDSTNTAIDELQARHLRDMQWRHNAHGRYVKLLQKESAAKRAEVQMEARAEIMSQPIYRVWAFLTGRMTADDKVTAPKPAKSDPNILDETVDSLFVAIAKLGGIKKDDVVTTWGVDPKDKPTSGLYGKPLWRVDGGLSIDGMAEALSQYGYLELDENGKWDIRELEERFKAELGGDTQLSTSYDYAGNQAPGKAGDEVINPDAVQAGRLSRAALEEMGLPVELVNHLTALKMVAKEGWHPDLLADRFQFESGDDMTRRIAAAESPKDAINGLTDQRMLERFGDLSSQEAIEKAADKAIHNEARARMMATELNALENALGKRKTLASAAKEYATAMIGRVKVRDLKPGQYASAEARALKAAQAASKSGDIAKAAAEQRNALINNYATRAAHDAQDSIDKLRRNMAALANRSDDKLKKTYDMDLVNAVRAILGEYGIAEKKAKRAIDYLEVFKQNDPDMYAVISEAVENASRNAKPFKELTVDDVRALGEEVAAILHLAKRSRQMEVDGDMIDRQEIEDALHARLVALGIPESMPGDSSAITTGEVAMQKFRTALAALTRVESWVGKMDGADTFGPFRRFVFGRVKNAADAYRSDKAKYLKQFSELFDSIRPTLKPSIISSPELGYTFGKDAGGSAINEIVHAILHTGNASNKRKLLLGRGWAQERPDGSLDTSRWDAFIQRMANEGKITKAHFDFAQGVWDLLESTKPLAQKTHRDVFGKYFDEVTAEPLNTPFGVYAGGYVPAMADSRVDQGANMRALAESENQAMQYAFPTTAKGFTKSRVEHNTKLMLDLRTLSQHIDKVLMFSHLEMPVRDVQRVMRGIGGTLNKVDPAAITGLITPWLNRAAKQQVMAPMSNDAGLSRFLSVMRSRAGAAAMFGNLANAVQQITGFSLASLKVRPSLMLSATADFAKHPKAFVAAVTEASPYMAERLDSEVAAMNDNINQILLNPSLLEKGQAWSMRHAYFLQTAIDSAMSPIIWTAAYNQALEQNHSPEDAVRLGDSAVRETQGSSLPEDISRYESGPAWARLFTQFAGYFNMQANLLGTEYAKMIQQDYGLRKNAGKGLFIFMLGFYVPAVVGELVMQLFKGGPGDDDKDGEYLDDWLAVLFGWAPLRTATAMVPIVGHFANSVINGANNKTYDDRMVSSPAISMLESGGRALLDHPGDLVNGNLNNQKAVRDVATLISMTVGIPVNLAARPIGYMAGVKQSKIVPASGPDMVRGLVTGIASPDSKR